MKAVITVPDGVTEDEYIAFINAWVTVMKIHGKQTFKLSKSNRKIYNELLNSLSHISFISDNPFNDI